MPVRDVPNYLAAFQISGCPLHLPAHAPREYSSINTTTATLPLLSHFHFSLCISVLLLFLVPSGAQESPALQGKAQNEGWDLQLVGRQSTTLKVFGNWLAGLLFCVSPVVVVVVVLFPENNNFIFYKHLANLHTSACPSRNPWSCRAQLGEVFGSRNRGEI